MKFTAKLFMLLILVVFIASVSGVYGVWIFSEEKVDNESDQVKLILSDFTWAPEEILPTVTPGQNYLDLFESILNNSKAGLNSDKAVLENAVLKYKEVHSGQNVTGGNLKHLFITEKSRDLDFMVEYISDNEFHLYMYEHHDTIDGLVGVTKIVAYKTIIIYENNEWDALEAQLGYATLQYFNGSNVVAIDLGTWEKGSLTV